MHNLDSVFGRLAGSTFRRRFRLGAKEKDYLLSRGRDIILAHAADFVSTRLAPAILVNDGKQTPMRGHPVFIAQHATATCCRSCLSKWHRIAPGQALSAEEQAYVVSAIARWIDQRPESSS